MIQRKLFRIANRTTLWRKSFKLIAQVKSWAFKFWHFQTNQHKKTFRSSLLLVLCTTSTNQNENSKFPFIIHVEKTALDFGRNDSRREKKNPPNDHHMLFICAKQYRKWITFCTNWCRTKRAYWLLKKCISTKFTYKEIYPLNIYRFSVFSGFDVHKFYGRFFLFIHSVYRIDIAHT